MDWGKRAGGRTGAKREVDERTGGEWTDATQKKGGRADERTSDGLGY